jgi:RNase P subunit RPR2
MVNQMDEKICEKCHTHFIPDKHELGLVVNDSVFICEDCHNKMIETEDIDSISLSTKINQKGMPIALWLIEQQNKGKQFMSMKK